MNENEAKKRFDKALSVECDSQFESSSSSLVSFVEPICCSPRTAPFRRYIFKRVFLRDVNELFTTSDCVIDRVTQSGGFVRCVTILDMALGSAKHCLQ